jgi:hypothetical protein
LSETEGPRNLRELLCTRFAPGVAVGNAVGGQVVLEGKLRLTGKRAAIAFGEQAQLFHHAFRQAKADGPVFVPVWDSAGATHRHIVL